MIAWFKEIEFKNQMNYILNSNSLTLLNLETKKTYYHKKLFNCIVRVWNKKFKKIHFLKLIFSMFNNWAPILK